jgi:hypothetical protein
MSIYYRKTLKKYTLTENYIIELPYDVESYLSDHDYYTLKSNDDKIHINCTSLLTIKKGYMWDGPSGPTVDTKSFMRGSLVHDALYQLMREKKISLDFKDKADRILQQYCKEDGMNSLRAWYVYRAVKKFGLSSATPKPIKVIKAP